MSGLTAIIGYKLRNPIGEIYSKVAKKDITISEQDVATELSEIAEGINQFPKTCEDPDLIALARPIESSDADTLEQFLHNSVFKDHSVKQPLIAFWNQQQSLISLSKILSSGNITEGLKSALSKINVHIFDQLRRMFSAMRPLQLPELVTASTKK